jgi:hypothetical protein
LSFRSVDHTSSCSIIRAAPFILCCQAAAAAHLVGEHGIVNAARIGDGTLVFCHLVVDCHRVNYSDVGITPLHESARKGHLSICRLLLQCNANVEAKDDE